MSAGDTCGRGGGGGGADITGEEEFEGPVPTVAETVLLGEATGEGDSGSSVLSVTVSWSCELSGMTCVLLPRLV